MMDLDSKETVTLHKKIIYRKLFLYNLYKSYYRQLLSKAKKSGKIVELGSGGGFIKDVNSKIITSDVVKMPGIDKKFSATKIPFDNSSIDAFVMLNVFHHIPNSAKALGQMQRCLKTGGKIIMIEPYNTLWSRFIYKNFHHECFDVDAGWGFKGKGRLTDSNMALPWIVFVRDRKLFSNKFSNLKIISITPHSPFSYILSGGLSKPQLAPNFTFSLIMIFEKLISPLNRFLAIYATFVIEKTAA